MRRLAVAAGACFALVVGISVAAVPAPAGAITGADFDPGYIISDAQFYASTSLAEADIQSFLDAKGPVSCNTPQHPGYTCLYDLSFPTFDKPANPMCRPYQGASDESVARIVSKVGIACGISPKVLLVMLQKEQGLITDTWPTTGQLATAMGAGCPDTAACDPAQKGFFQQVYLAAYYMVRYGMPAGTGPGTEYTSNYRSNYRIGEISQILYKDNNPDCGTRSVVVRNQPTASLYWYTPYTPNAAALTNLYGLGDGCSTYGNRNFWTFYSNWFGNPAGITLAGVVPTRIDGIDRFDTALKISARRSVAADVIYIANGYNYPDALSAAPAAVMGNGPLLLVPGDTVPAAVAAEIRRLTPKLIVVVGGEAAVSRAAYDALTALAPTIRRDGADDRFSTSRLIAANGFPTGATLAYIATGNGFADALSASAAAGYRKAPVILVDGSASTLDGATAQTLATLGVTSVIIAGGPVAVSAGVEAGLRAIPGITVNRLGGADRFAVAAALNRDAFPVRSPVYVASAYNFPDALAGAVLAGSQGAALYLSPTPCIYRSVVQDFITIQAPAVTLLGGPAALSQGVQSYLNCD